MTTNNTAAKPTLKVSELEYLLWHIINNTDGITGYDATKIISANFDKFTHQQVYRTLNRREGELWVSTVVPQDGRPDKKVYTIVNNYKFVVDYNLLTINTLMLVGTKEIIEGYIEFKEKMVETLVEKTRKDTESKAFLADSDIYNYRKAHLVSEIETAKAIFTKLAERECSLYQYQQ